MGVVMRLIICRVEKKTEHLSLNALSAFSFSWKSYFYDLRLIVYLNRQS